MGRKNVELQLCRLTLEQLDQYVLNILGAPLSHYAAGTNVPVVVNNLLSTLIMQQKDAIFLKEISDKLLVPELKSAVYEYLKIPIPLNYNALVVYNRPFIDRAMFRHTLSSLFNQQLPNILITKGARYSGRTHSHWLIQYATQSIGLRVIRVDLLDDYKRPKDLQDIIALFANRMAFQAGELRDKLALASTQAKGLASAISGWLSSPNGAFTKWCFIFDHYDIDGVKTECRDFVDNLISDIATNLINNVWIIILGYDSIVPSFIRPAVIEEHIFPIQFSDVENYLVELAISNGKALSRMEASKICDAIFTGLKNPLDVDDMEEMIERLRAHIS